MLSKKTVAIFALTAVGLLVLLGTPMHLGEWSELNLSSFHEDPHDNQHAPQGAFGDNLAHNHHAGFTSYHGTRPEPDDYLSVCENVPDTSNFLLVMKTGASESFARIPTQLMTMLKCLPDFLIFGDANQNIGGYTVFDSLEKVLPEVMEGNPDFDLYRRQKTCEVDIDTCNKVGDPAKEGWDLDKYKNLHIAERAYAMRPGYDFYVFVDADTYVLLPNMARWLRQIDPNKKRYFGSVSMLNDFPFGHGGSGYIVSRAAMEDLVGKNPGLGNMYDERASKECCGDYVFAVAIKEKSDVGVEQMWPTINGDKSTTIPYGPSHWCQPITTMHHMNSEEIDAFWKFERDFYQAQDQHREPQPLLIKDIYHRYMAPKITSKRMDWDNNSEDRFYVNRTDPNNLNMEDWKMDRMKKQSEYNAHEELAHLSPEHCRAACRSVSYKECFQYKFEDGVCSFANSIKLGKPVKKKSNEAKRVVSGWDVAKIESWVAKQKCTTVDWPGIDK